MMKIFMITYNDELTSHVEQCFRHCDCEVTTFCFPEPVYTNNFVILTEKNRIVLLETLKNTTFDIIFSVEYILMKCLLFQMHLVLFICPG